MYKEDEDTIIAYVSVLFPSFELFTFVHLQILWENA